jgi:hypothetical protein
VSLVGKLVAKCQGVGELRVYRRLIANQQEDLLSGAWGEDLDQAREQLEKEAYLQEIRDQDLRLQLETQAQIIDMLLTRAPQPQHCFQVVRASAIQGLTRELAPWVDAGELARYLSFYEAGTLEDPFEKLRQAHKPQLLSLLNQHVVELEQQRLEEVN